MEDNNVDSVGSRVDGGQKDGAVKRRETEPFHSTGQNDPADTSEESHGSATPDSKELEASSTLCHEDEYASSESGGSEGEEDDEQEERDARIEIWAPDDAHETSDNEVEKHVMAVGTDLSESVMVEASRTALFRRYSRLTPETMEEHERSLHEEPPTETIPTSPRVFCPEPTDCICENPACVDQLRWRDMRIAELQAALDHITEAMAIQQRDMASQRVFLSRQAEQLTKLSNKLHHDKVALHIERERFHKLVASTPSATAIALNLKPAAGGKIKSPVKKLLAAAGRRASLTSLECNSPFPSLDAATRSSSSSQLRHNPLVDIEPFADRSASLSALKQHESSNRGTVALTPTKDDRGRQFFPNPELVGLVDVTLSPPKQSSDSCGSSSRLSSPTPQSPPLQPLLEPIQRADRVDSAEQRRQSLGDRLRSLQLKWTRS